MASDDRCPATGRICRKTACEQGGCRRMLTGPARPPTPKPKPRAPAPVAAAAPEPGAPHELTQLRDALAAASAVRTELEAAVNEAIHALEHSDAALTHLQQSLGVKSSPRIEELRRVKTLLRTALKIRPAAAAPAAPAPSDV
jgi:hypothetical protein